VLNILIQTTALPIILGLSAYAPTGAWAANGIAPELVASFKRGDEFFAYNGERTTFDDMFTVSTTGLATMTDSDGLVKWNAHNLAVYSNDFTQFTNFQSTDATEAGSSPIDDTTVAYVYPTGTSSSIYQSSQPLPLGKVTLACWIKARGATQWFYLNMQSGVSTPSGARNAWFDLTNGVIGSKTTLVEETTIEAYPDDWYLCKMSLTWTSVAGNEAISVGLCDADGGSTVTVNAANGVYLAGFHCYKDDLGGMVDNPDRTDTYVPTTAAAVYLPRRNAYYYNGTSYVKGGLRWESSAATNRLPDSNDFEAASWTITATDSLTLTAAQAVGADGESSLTELAITDTTNESHALF